MSEESDNEILEKVRGKLSENNYEGIIPVRPILPELYFVIMTNGGIMGMEEMIPSFVRSVHMNEEEAYKGLYALLFEKMDYVLHRVSGDDELNYYLTEEGKPLYINTLIDVIKLISTGKSQSEAMKGTILGDYDAGIMIQTNLSETDHLILIQFNFSSPDDVIQMGIQRYR